MLSRSYQLLFASGALFLSSGCAMCCGLYDNDYLATSELLQRTDPSQGRVGSVFSDPNVGMTGHWSEDAVMLDTAPESLPTPMRSEQTPQPTPAAPETAMPSRELIQRSMPTPASSIPGKPTLAKPISVKEDPQTRRSVPAPNGISGPPRKLTNSMATPLPATRQFERQPIRQVTSRQ